MAGMQPKIAERQTYKESFPAKRSTMRPETSSDSTGGKIFWMQHAVGNQAVQRMASECSAFSACPTGGMCHTCPYRVQAKQRIGQVADPYEQEADRIGEQVFLNPEPVMFGEMKTSLRTPRVQIQRKCAGCEEEEPRPGELREEPWDDEEYAPVAGSEVTGMVESTGAGSETAAISMPPEQAAAAGGPTSEGYEVSGTQEPMSYTAATSPVAEQTGVHGLVVEDSAVDLAPEQMRKSEFLGELRGVVLATAEEALAGTEWSTEDCPWIEYWFGYYAGRDALHVERAIRRYAPETISVSDARDFIPLISQRVRRAVLFWSATGEITGVPEGVTTGLPPSEGATESPPSPIRYKARDGAAINAGAPIAISGRLGTGRALDSGVRSSMEHAFGGDFSRVRIHTDATAARLSSSLNARAFTVGNDVAFATGEYQPDTPVGSALIAHELAHVLQQKGQGSGARLEKGAQESGELEVDADNSAIGAVVSLWGSLKGQLVQFGQNALPRLKSGLRLQRCKKGAPTATPYVSIGNFRNRGSTADSGENNCALCPLPLGILAGSGKNRMELRGDITNHQAGTDYDFKRTKERGTWKLVGGTWTQISHVGPGEDDDSHNDDEDLTPENNHIYTEDGPGFRDLVDPVSDAAATEAVYKASFIETANVRVSGGSWTKSSNDVNWHSITWLEKVGGNWQRKAGNNEIETGSTTVGTGNP